MDWIWMLLAFVAGCLLGTYRDALWRSAPVVPAGVAPKGAMAVLMDGDREVSRRLLQADTSQITRYHGRHANESFVYVGRDDAGDCLFRVNH